MSEAAIRAQIKTTLEAVSGIGVVHNRRRYSKSAARWLKLMTKEGAVNGWTTHRKNTPTIQANNAQVERQYYYEIFGIYELDDVNDSQAEFDAIIEAIFAAFKADRSLSGTALDSDLLDVVDVDEEEYERQLYHVCELGLVVKERVSST